MYRRLIYLVLVSLFVSVPVHAATTVPAGSVSGTWILSDSPYLIEGDITVPAGETLTIEPGVVVEFQNWYKLLVNGYLQAVGTESQRILFTATPPGPGEPGWGGIDFVDAPDGSRMAYCIVENGQSRAATPNDRGGAIYILNSSPLIRHCTLRNNTVSLYGGAIYCENGNPTIENSTITGNSAGNAGTAAGGGIYCFNSQPRILGNIISHNNASASSAFNAANALGGGIFLRSSDARIENNIIAYNRVSASGNIPTHYRGGAIYIYTSSPQLVGNTIYGNTTNGDGITGEGGALFVYYAHPTMVNTILWNNSAQGREVVFAPSSTNSFLAAYSDVQGGQGAVETNGSGSVYWQEGNIDADPLFADPANDGFDLQAASPAVDVGTAYYAWQGTVLVDLASDAYSGAAPDMGAAEYAGAGGPNQPPVAVAASDRDHGSAPLTIQFSSNGSADPDGTLVAYAWDFDDGTTSSEPNPTHTFYTIDTYSVRLTVTDNDGATDTKSIIVTVQDGTTIWGGDVSGRWTLAGSPYRIEGDFQVPAGASLTIDPGVRVAFQYWYKMTVTGHLQADGTADQPITFTATPPGPGETGWIGIFFIDAAGINSMTHCIIENAQATAADPNDRGGALYVLNATLNLTQCTLRNNRVRRYGGAIYADQATLTLDGCTLTGNLVGYGGVAYGGAIYASNSQLHLMHSVLRNNRAGASGGFGPANGSGGALYLTATEAFLEYNVVSDNSVEASGNVPTYSRGGAIFATDTTLHMTSNTFTGNSTNIDGRDNGGGLYLLSSEATLVNSILWNDSPQEIVLADAADTFMAAYSDIQGGQSGVADYGGGALYWQPGNIDSDPLFVDAVANDYTLQAGSPGVNTGIAYFVWQGQVLVDLDPTQYTGSAPDMGALESAFTQPVNQPPTAVADAAPITGAVPLTVQFDSSGSSDADGSILGYLWDFDTGATSTDPNPSYSYTAAGTYQALLTVEDDQGAMGSDMVEIVVSSPEMTLHVADQTISRKRFFRRFIRAVDTVRVVDRNNTPVSGVLVSAVYSGPSSGTVSGTTGSDGTVALTTGYVWKPKGTWCFKVLNLTKEGYTYDSDADVVTTICE